MMRRKGYALTMMLLMLSVVLAVTFSGIFDAASPRIQKANENTRKLAEMLNEIRDALNMLRIKAVNDDLGVPSKEVLNAAEFSDMADRNLWVPSIVKDLEFEFSDTLNSESVSILVTCELYEHVEIYPYKINIPGVTIEDKEVKMLVQYRKGDVM